MPFCNYFGRAGKGAQVDLDGLLPDLDALDDGLDDLPFLLGGEARPALVEVAGLRQDLVAPEVLDLEEVELALQPRQLRLEGRQALLERLVGPAEALGGDLVADVQAIGLVHLLADLGSVSLEGGEPFLLLVDLLVGPSQMRRHILRREKEALELLVEDRLEVPDRDLQVAAVADVLGHVGGNVELVTTLTEGVAGE